MAIKPQVIGVVVGETAQDGDTLVYDNGEGGYRLSSGVFPPGSVVATLSRDRPTPRGDVTVLFKGGMPNNPLSGDLWLGAPPPAADSPQPRGAMMGGNDGGHNTAGGVHVLTLPVNATVGDVMIVASVGNTSQQTASILSGAEDVWLLRSGPDISAASTGFRMFIWSKTLVSDDLNEDITITWTGSTMGVSAGVVYPGGVTVRQPEFTTVMGGASSISPVGISTYPGNTLMTVLAVKANSGSVPQTPTYPDGTTVDKMSLTAQESGTNYGMNIAHSSVPATGIYGTEPIETAASTNGMSVYSLIVSP